MAKDKATVVFIHGLWLHATSYQPWEDYFNKAGYETLAPGWPNEPSTVKIANQNPEAVAGFGIEDVTNYYADIIRSLDSKPILIGHSFGGLIVQKLMGMGLGRAGVALDPAPIKGVLILPIASLRSASVALKNPANRKRAVALTLKQFHYSFTNTLEEQESAELYEKWAIPSPGRPLFEAAAANFNPNSPAKVAVNNPDRGPLLITGGKKDQTVPASISRATYKLYRKSPAVTDYKEYADRGHSLALDHGWQEVAGDVLAWLKQNTK